MFGKLQMHEIRTIIIKITGIDNILSPASLRTEVKKKEIPWSVQQCTKNPKCIYNYEYDAQQHLEQSCKRR